MSVSEQKFISIRGARTHNLQNIDIDLPRNKLIVITGPSGSGKSSLAFDTIYAEGQRRYVESLSTYARQFLSVMEKPDVDHIEGLSPAISIEQKSTSHNPRSTVGTITEIYDYLRLLYARVGEPRCPDHQNVLQAQSVSQMVDQVLALEEGTKVMLLAPVIQQRKGEHLQLLQELRAQGYVRARIDGGLVELDSPPELNPKQKHDIEVVIDRIKVRQDLRQRLADSIETALALSDGLLKVGLMDSGADDLIFSAKFACPVCSYSIAELEPRMFSFNNPAGACQQCDGLGATQMIDPDLVVAHPDFSIAGGAIPGWDRRNGYYMQVLQGLADHYGFDLETPFQDLSVEHQQRVMYGSGDDHIEFLYVTERGRKIDRIQPFEGVVNNIRRRYRETDSAAVREQLARFQNHRDCEACCGERLKTEARNVFVADQSLPQVTRLTIRDACQFFETLKLEGARLTIADKILREINLRLKFLLDVGLDYLTLDRTSDTLSGGEAQRIRLASQLGAGLVGVMYVLDEPSIGLHQRDNQRLLETLMHLRDLGNTVIVIEHDEEAMRAADHLVDIGPGAGMHGGRILAEGTLAQVLANPESATGPYLSGEKSIAVPDQRVPINRENLLRITGASGHNLKHVNIDIPVGLMTCITGVSGSGKSTLINGTLYRAAARQLYKSKELPEKHEAIEGLEHFDKVINIDQSAIGRTPRSNPATYTGLFTPIRELFAATSEARTRGYKSGRFSFNVKGGRCESCQGDGLIKVEMHFLADIYVPCDVCHGQRYNRETLEIKYKGKNIHEVLQMTAEEGAKFYAAVPQLSRKLETLIDVGLGYITLGQSATTLSGGEAQRVKLARELSKRDTGKTLYILDEPTTGLHFQDIEHLLAVLQRLRDHGNTIIVIEHNLDVIKTADWVVDMGPEGGAGGGELVVAGTPETVAACTESHTGRYLQPLLAANAIKKSA